MTHAYARGDGEMPAPRRFDEPHQRREVVSSRAAWCPTAPAYRLPAGVRDRLSAALEGRKNKRGDADSPSRGVPGSVLEQPQAALCAIPVDRRALAQHEALGSAKPGARCPRGPRRGGVPCPVRARGRQEVHQRTEGGLQRRAILHRFGVSMPSRSRQRMLALRQPVERQRHPAGHNPRVPSPNGRQRPTLPPPGPCPHSKSPKSNP